ncbi:MAG: FliG C-terminal domain-containing protein [Rhodospirillales bacterium]|jgi:flagellar motor switch protein FliG|nr:hypothetical protein [Rhodospirillaceae bacterium]MDP6427292.1 FliG C-terminal domain-containing protein [Rhodospirillales bacterium]MDP6645319.1 FliG C-terminal domain-containing protein [Rhodospirillales bacterium]|tara:strand:- start:789 stop:1247 length:459 start_codon:yes stop_codon:yes gene_type:complete
MDIEVNRVNEDRFEIILEDRRTVVDRDGLARLSRHLNDLLDPVAREARAERYNEFLDRLQTANNTGIQALLGTAAHDDILVLLHSSEENAELRKKLYANMSDNSVKIYVEDLLFQFREGLPGYRFDEAMRRLIETAENLVEDGALSFDGQEG